MSLAIADHTSSRPATFLTPSTCRCRASIRATAWRKDKPVVILCQAGGRSRKALGIAQPAGRGDLKHYPGGMTQWRMHGGPLSIISS
jgi:rhodanese-related sulfurtransferase